MTICLNERFRHARNVNDTQPSGRRASRPNVLNLWNLNALNLLNAFEPERLEPLEPFEPLEPILIKRMRFAILGSGAVGGYYGAKLARAGQDVTFVARGAHLEAIRARGPTHQAAPRCEHVSADAAERCGQCG